MMKKWLKPKKDSFLQEQFEQESQTEKQALSTEEFSKRFARILIHLRELIEVRNKIIRQFVPETCDCRRKH